MRTFSQDTSLAAMLDRTGPTADTPAGMQPVAEALEALGAAPMDDELAGQAAAMAEFRQRLSVAHQPDRPQRRRAASWFSARTAAAAALAGISLGGVAAAYSGSLPAAVQQLAHKAIGAPAPSRPASPRPQRPRPAHARPARPLPPRHQPVRGGTPAGPEATGPAAHALCSAYEHAGSPGDGRAVALRNLVAAAGGENNIKIYCSAVLPPRTARYQHGTGDQPSSRHFGSHYQAGKPDARPPAHPAERTASHPAGGPSSSLREVTSH